jgi:lipopolysaccharide/colanic/teichoic acid biosynthesis glycosyltransferase
MVALENGALNRHDTADRSVEASRVARLIRNAVRRSDVVASYREDQLAIILGEVDASGATAAAARLRSLLEDPEDGCRTVSCETPAIRAGVASYPSDALESTQLVDQAQKALHVASTLSGNPVRAAGDEDAVARLNEQKGRYLILKRWIDIVLSLVLLMIALPLVLLIGLFIKLDSPGPILYSQGRVGLRRRSEGKCVRWETGTFECHKFRTMYHHASQASYRSFIRALAERQHSSDTSNVEHESTFKLVNDPRVTRVGRVLRKTSLDEVPQLINVLRGEMSLVGPRPATLHEAAHFNGWRRERLAAQAGLTGLWQVKGRGRVSMDDMLRLDVEYVRKQSLWLDLKILLLTIPAVLSCRGAA